IAVAITGYMIVKGTSDQPSTFDKSGFGVTVYSDAKPCSDIPNSLEEGGYIRDYIIQSADFFELPSGYLAAVMEQESQFKPTATSPVGARGLMQLMPDTYKQLNAQELSDTSAELAKARGFTKGNDVYRNIYTKKIEREGSVPITYLGAPNDADIVNVKYNTFLGAAYYRQHFDDFKHATKYHKAFTDKQLQEVMLAAYNAGPGAVDKYNGVPPIKETKEYVKNIMARFKIYEGCMKQEKAGASSNAAKILEKYVADNPKIACQFNNPVGGPNGCARTARDV
ncbi:MAG: transglycosylase SLT domain-containing protein, partial [Patescibacteria group bacterium]